MPQTRASKGVYVTAGVAVLHGAPACDGGAAGQTFAGIAIKQKQEGPDIGYGATRNKQVQVGEEYFLNTKGTWDVANVDKNAATFVKGAVVYIDPTDNALTSSSSSTVKFGVVLAIAGERGVATGRMLVDLDLRSDF